MNLPTKVAVALGLIGIALFVVLTGRTNVHNFERVQQSIEEMFEDRLVVKGLIFDLASLLHRKEVAILSEDTTFYAHLNASVNDQIDDRLEEFWATRLTPMEERTLKRFASNVDALQASEEQLDLAETMDLSPDEEQRLAGQLASLEEDLQALSKIQLSEGRRKLSVGAKAVDDMNWIARIENYMLIALVVLLLALIFIPLKARPVD